MTAGAGGLSVVRTPTDGGAVAGCPLLGFLRRRGRRAADLLVRLPTWVERSTIPPSIPERSRDEMSYLRSVHPVSAPLDKSWQPDLDADELACLRALQRIEYNTACYLRDALVSRAHHDPVVSDFLVGWAYEETHHGLALADLLAAAGTPVTDRQVEDERRSRSFIELVKHVGFTATTIIGFDLFALHMATGFLNELIARETYERLAARFRDDEVVGLLRRMAGQEAKHAHFYRTQLAQAMASGRVKRRLVRAYVARIWEPVGSTVSNGSDYAAVVSVAFPDGSRDPVWQQLDDKVQAVAGLERLSPFSSRLATRFRALPMASGT